METSGTARRRGSVDVMLVTVLLMIGMVMMVESAAVVDSGDKQQLVPNSVGESTENTGCDDGRLINCRTLPLFNYTDLSPPQVTHTDANSDIVQDENCPYTNFERHLRCVDVFTKRCMTTEQRAAFYTLYSVPTLAMQELCTEGGPYREEYLKHAACLQTVHEEYLQCGRKHQSELAAIMEQEPSHPHQKQQEGDERTSLRTTASPFTGSEQITQNLIHLCGSFKGHLLCVNGIVRATCGPTTEEFASQFLGQMASSLLNICNKYGNQVDGKMSRSTSSGIRWMSAPTAALTLSTAVAFLTSMWN